jgi:hypothetical protein
MLDPRKRNRTPPTPGIIAARLGNLEIPTGLISQRSSRALTVRIRPVLLSMNESEYHKLVSAWLDSSFSDIDHEPYLDSGRIPDFIVHTPFESYVIEVEDGWDSLYAGIGQAAVYASETGHKPVVIMPTVPDQEPGWYWGVRVETV